MTSEGSADLRFDRGFACLKPVPPQAKACRRTRRSALPHSPTLSVGMDVHKASMAVAYVAQDHGAKVVFLGSIGTRQCDLDKLIRQLQSKSKALVFVSEAGPGGDWLSRYLTQKGQVC